jgi:tetratricopeptide (TPR) repeat protein
VSAKGRTVLSSLVITLLIVAALERNAVLRTPLSAWQDVAAKNPRSSRVRNNLGHAYAQSGRFAEAIEEYRIAISLRKYNIDPYFNLASSYETIGRIDLAIPYYAFYCQYETNDSPKAVADRKLACDRASQIRGGF